MGARAHCLKQSGLVGGEEVPQKKYGLRPPFYDNNEDTHSRVTAAVCKSMARGGKRDMFFSVPGEEGGSCQDATRIFAPKALYLTPSTYGASTTVELLPKSDGGQST